jgi:integrase
MTGEIGKKLRRARKAADLSQGEVAARLGLTTEGYGHMERGIGARTVRLTHAVLHRALNQALKWTLVPRNPAAAVDKPKAQRAEMRVWTVEQAQAFLAAIRDHRLYALYHLAITTGLRRGELLGLKWSDLDGDRLSVQRQLQRVPGAGLTLSEPKTARGRRSVTLARVDLAALRERRETQQRERLFAGDAWQDSGLIFTTPKGTPCDPDNAGHTFRTLTLAVGLPPIRFHDLRHTAATIMLTRGVHPKVVQERLGHASIELTMDTYSHVVANMQAHAAAQIDALFEQ